MKTITLEVDEEKARVYWERCLEQPSLSVLGKIVMGLKITKRDVEELTLAGIKLVTK